ncbi:GspH/FimT family pseudopilin [Nitrosomonas marina]|uniref:Type II secretion system protein H n=1 Tax=Nitrosomonas marina TaxID=917 RepID=A0A1H8CNB4_9PROT|nr:GspH/FimT family pseudopilin [Nitrosomonas marina]SEM96633.1 type IV fimbrial biogenesis protein FimT [Nitrosomonas marina]
MNNLAIDKGFTLIELVVTLSVAGILLAVAAPNYQEFVQESRITAQSNSILSSMMLTKSEAIKRNSPATICPSTSGTACTGGTVWSNGWIVFADTNGDGVVDAGEEVIQVAAAFTGGNTLQTGGGDLRVTFSANGFSMGFNSTFSLCDSRGSAHSRAVILNNQGRVRTEKGSAVC